MTSELNGGCGGGLRPTMSNARVGHELKPARRKTSAHWTSNESRNAAMFVRMNSFIGIVLLGVRYHLGEICSSFFSFSLDGSVFCRVSYSAGHWVNTRMCLARMRTCSRDDDRL